jgi:hypothetical protein
MLAWVCLWCAGIGCHLANNLVVLQFMTIHLEKDIEMLIMRKFVIALAKRYSFGVPCCRSIVLEVRKKVYAFELLLRILYLLYSQYQQ